MALLQWPEFLLVANVVEDDAMHVDATSQLQRPLEGEPAEQ